MTMSTPRGNPSGPFFTNDITDLNDPLHHPHDQGPDTDSFVPSTNVPSSPDGPDGHADTLEAVQPGVPDTQPDHGGAKDVVDDLQTSNKTNVADGSTTDHGSGASHQDQVLLDGFDLGDSHP